MKEKFSIQYARALYELAEDKDLKVLEQLELVSKVISANKEFKIFLSHPQIQDDDKKAVFEKVLVDFDELVLNFLYVLIDNKRISSLDSIIEEYRNIYYDKHNLMKFEIITATPLSSEEQERIENILHLKYQKEIILDANVEPKHLGGIVVKHQNQVLDDSIITRVTSIRDYLKNKKLR